jgi:hypothetical protein
MTALLHQIMQAPLGPTLVEFDFLAGLADAVEGGSFPDAFFASVYFTDDPAQFDLANKVYAGALPLVDLDANQTDAHGGTLASSGLGGSWRHYSAIVDNRHAYIVPVFELFGLNGVGGDSQCVVDNVAAVPEPGAAGIWS